MLPIHPETPLLMTTSKTLLLHLPLHLLLDLLLHLLQQAQHKLLQLPFL